MAQQLVSYEVLATPIAPGVPNVPYVQQGFFLQITNLGPSDTHVQTIYVGTPAFVASSGSVTLFANIIDQTGNPTQVPASSFLAPPIGFGATAIPAGATYLLGVQYLLIPGSGTHMVGGTPQDNLESRGYVSISAMAGSTILVQPTVRQVFNNYDPTTGNLLDIDSTAYAVPVSPAAVMSF